MDKIFGPLPPAPTAFQNITRLKSADRSFDYYGKDDYYAHAYVMASRPFDSLTLLTGNAKALFRKLGEFDGINRVALEHIHDSYACTSNSDFASRGEVKTREAEIQKNKVANTSEAKIREAEKEKTLATPSMQPIKTVRPYDRSGPSL